VLRILPYISYLGSGVFIYLHLKRYFQYHINDPEDLSAQWFAHLNTEMLSIGHLLLALINLLQFAAVVTIQFKWKRGFGFYTALRLTEMLVFFLFIVNYFPGALTQLTGYVGIVIAAIFIFLYYRYHKKYIVATSQTRSNL
jgi:hypothetical protein